MRIAHVLTFYDSLRNVLFLNHFVRVLTHTRHYTSTFGSVIFLMEHRRALEQEAERTGTHKTQTTSLSLTESWCMVIWEGTG